MSQELITQITTALGGVNEPTLDKNIATLNMVKNVAVKGKTAQITINPMTTLYAHEASLAEMVKSAVMTVDGIDSVAISFESDIPTNPQIYGQMGLKIKNLIAISSGKGGVGKSTVSTNLAVALARSGARVGLLDADITGPNLPLLMGLEGHKPVTDGQGLIPLEAHGVKVISMGFLLNPKQSVIWRGPMIHHAIRQLFTDVSWGELDYMLVDLPPGTSDAQLTLAQTVPVSGVVIVTQPQQVAVGDALRGMAMFREVKANILGVIENMSGELFGSGGGKALAEEQGVPFLGSVPLEAQVRIGTDSGQPVVIATPDSPAARAFTDIASDITVRLGEVAQVAGTNLIPLRTIE